MVIDSGNVQFFLCPSKPGQSLETHSSFCVQANLAIDSGNVQFFLCPSKAGHGINKQSETGHGIWKTHYITNCTQAEMTTLSENYAINSAFQEKWAKDSAKPTTSDRRSSKTKYSIENPRDSPSFSSKAVHGSCKCSRFHGILSSPPVHAVHSFVVTVQHGWTKCSYENSSLGLTTLFVLHTQE